VIEADQINQNDGEHVSADLDDLTENRVYVIPSTTGE